MNLRVLYKGIKFLLVLCGNLWDNQFNEIASELLFKLLKDFLNGRFRIHKLEEIRQLELKLRIVGECCKLLNLVPNFESLDMLRVTSGLLKNINFGDRRSIASFTQVNDRTKFQLIESQLIILSGSLAQTNKYSVIDYINEYIKMLSSYDLSSQIPYGDLEIIELLLLRLPIIAISVEDSLSLKLIIETVESILNPQLGVSKLNPSNIALKVASYNTLKLLASKSMITKVNSNKFINLTIEILKEGECSELDIRALFTIKESIEKIELSVGLNEIFTVIKNILPSATQKGDMNRSALIISIFTLLLDRISEVTMFIEITQLLMNLTLLFEQVLNQLSALENNYTANSNNVEDEDLQENSNDCQKLLFELCSFFIFCLRKPINYEEFFINHIKDFICEKLVLQYLVNYPCIEIISSQVHILLIFMIKYIKICNETFIINNYSKLFGLIQKKLFLNNYRYLIYTVIYNLIIRSNELNITIGMDGGLNQEINQFIGRCEVDPLKINSIQDFNFLCFSVQCLAISSEIAISKSSYLNGRRNKIESIVTKLPLISTDELEGRIKAIIKEEEEYHETYEEQMLSMLSTIKDMLKLMYKKIFELCLSNTDKQLEKLLKEFYWRMSLPKNEKLLDQENTDLLLSLKTKKYK